MKKSMVLFVVMVLVSMAGCKGKKVSAADRAERVLSTKKVGNKYSFDQTMEELHRFDQKTLCAVYARKMTECKTLVNADLISLSYRMGNDDKMKALTPIVDDFNRKFTDGDEEVMRARCVGNNWNHYDPPVTCLSAWKASTYKKHFSCDYYMRCVHDLTLVQVMKVVNAVQEQKE